MPDYPQREIRGHPLDDVLQELTNEVYELRDMIERERVYKPTKFKGQKTGSDFTTTDLPHHGDYGARTDEGEIQYNIDGTIYVFASVPASGSYAPSPHDMTSSHHEASGATAGYVIRASGATAFDWAELQHSDLGGVGSEDHQDLVTIGSGGLSAKLGLSGQELILADINHSDLTSIGTDDHHAGFIGLSDNADADINPAADDRIQVTDDGVINADAGTNTLDLTIDQAQISHDSISDVSTDDHHAGFIGLSDNADADIDPAADDRIQVTDDGVINADAGTNTLDLTIDQAQIDHGNLAGLGDDDHSAVYPGYAQTETVTGTWTFDNAIYVLDGGVVGVSGGVGWTFDDTNGDVSTTANVGIGFASPAAKLAVDGGVHVGGTSDPGDNNLLVDGAGEFDGDLTVDADFYVMDGGTTILKVDESQNNVGIMTASPDSQFALDVNGPIRGQYLIGPHALQFEDAVAIWHFDGSYPFETHYDVDLRGHLGQAPSTVSGGVIGRPGKFGKAVQVAEATTNEVPNPVFRDNVTDGWATTNPSGGSVTHDTSFYYIEGGSAKITAGSSFVIHATGSILTLADGESVTAQIRAYTDDTPGDMILRIRDQTNGTIRADTYMSVSGQWEYLTATWTNDTGGSVDVRMQFNNNANDSSSEVWIDGAQLEQKSYPTPLAHGDMGDGHSWQGVDHNSATDRTVTSLIYNNALPSDLKDAGSWSFWFSPYLNLDGSLTGYGYNDIAILRFADNENHEAMWLRWNNNGDAQIAIRNDDSYRVVYGASFSANEWHLVTYTWDKSAGTAAVYVDGVEQDSTASFTGFEYDSLTYPDLNLYQAAVGGGYIDDLFIIDRALTAEEVRAIYESNAPIFAETSIQVWRSPTEVPVWVDEEGLWAIDADGNESMGWSAVQGKSWGGQSLDTGDFLLGQGSEYMLWDASAAVLDVAGGIHADRGDIAGWSITSTRLYSGNIELHTGGRIRHTDDDWRFNNDGSGQLAGGNITWDTAGNATFEGTITATSGSFTGTVEIASGGGLLIGSGTKDSDLTGWFADDAEIVGQSSGLDEVVLESDGTLTAGDTKLASDGITITSTTFLGWSRAYKFLDNNGEQIARFNAIHDTIGNYTSALLEVVESDEAHDTLMEIESICPSGQVAYIELTATESGAGSTELQVYTDGTKGYVGISGGGLYVGPTYATQNEGEITTSSDINCGGELIADGGATVGDGSSADITISFNDGELRNLYWDDSAGRFSFAEDVYAESVLGVADYAYALGGLHVGGTSDPGTDKLLVDGGTSLMGGVTMEGEVHYYDARYSYIGVTAYSVYDFHPLSAPATSTSWDGDAKSSSTSIDLSSVFGLPAGIAAIAATLSIQDETVDEYASIGPSSSNSSAIMCRTQTADVLIDAGGVCPCDASGDIYFDLTGELDQVYIRIWGYWL